MYRQQIADLFSLLTVKWLETTQTELLGIINRKLSSVQQ